MHCKEEYFCALQAVFQLQLKVFVNNINSPWINGAHFCVLVHTCTHCGCVSTGIKQAQQHLTFAFCDLGYELLFERKKKMSSMKA